MLNKFEFVTSSSN